MVLVVRRGALASVGRAGELAGAAAVAVVRDPAAAEAVRAWRPRPGKVCLRARSATQWEETLHLEPAPAIAGDAGGESVAAFAPMRRSERPALLDRLQAMSTGLEPPPAGADAADDRLAMTYVLNPRAPMSSGKSIAQVAHAAVIAADRGGVESWVAAGCPGRVLAPGDAEFDAVLTSSALVARVVDAGLTEVPPGTVTVIALAPGPASELPQALRDNDDPELRADPVSRAATV